MKFNGKTLSVAAEFKVGNSLDLIRYISPNVNLTYLFYKSEFPSGSVIDFTLDTPPASLANVFRLAVGFRKLVVTVPTTQVYDINNFIVGASAGTSTIEELVLPNGIKFSAFHSFAANCKKLRTITGSIDLSKSTDNTNCFLDCAALEEVRFVKRTITKSLYIKQSSNLSDETIQSIINGLDYDAEGQTLTVHPNVAARIVETDVTDAGWTLAY